MVILFFAHLIEIETAICLLNRNAKRDKMRNEMRRGTEWERNESTSHILLLLLLCCCCCCFLFKISNSTSNMHSAWLECQFQMTYIFDGWTQECHVIFHEYWCFWLAFKSFLCDFPAKTTIKIKINHWCHNVDSHFTYDFSEFIFRCENKTSFCVV